MLPRRRQLRQDLSKERQYSNRLAPPEYRLRAVERLCENWAKAATFAQYAYPALE